MQKAQVSGHGVVRKNEAIAFAFAFAAGGAEVGTGVMCVLHGCGTCEGAGAAVCALHSSRAGGGTVDWYE